LEYERAAGLRLVGSARVAAYPIARAASGPLECTSKKGGIMPIASYALPRRARMFLTAPPSSAALGLQPGQDAEVARHTAER
jgi:hypothetical protein